MCTSGLFSKVHSRPSVLGFFFKSPLLRQWSSCGISSLFSELFVYLLAVLLAVVLVVQLPVIVVLPLWSPLVTYRTTVTSGTEIPHDEKSFSSSPHRSSDDLALGTPFEYTQIKTCTKGFRIYGPSSVSSFNHIQFIQFIKSNSSSLIPIPHRFFYLPFAFSITSLYYILFMMTSDPSALASIGFIKPLSTHSDCRNLLLAATEIFAEKDWLALIEGQEPRPSAATVS